MLVRTNIKFLLYFSFRSIFSNIIHSLIKCFGVDFLLLLPWYFLIEIFISLVFYSDSWLLISIYKDHDYNIILI